MKRFLIQCLISALSLTIIPFSVYFFAGNTFTQPSQQEIIPENMGEVTLSEDVSRKKASFSDSIKVFNADTNTVMELDFRDYIIGVVAAEMPVVFHSEALSACTVAAATLARKRLTEDENQELSGAVISTDPAKHQAYMSKEEMQNKWGEDFDKYYEKLTKAVDKAIDYCIMYDNELIVAAYHAISPGKTENAENVWLAGYPYLVSVESEGDSLSPDYETSLSVPSEEFREKLISHGAEADGDDISIGEGKYTEAGTLMSITIGGKEFSGKELREIFSLRSACIRITKNDDSVVFNVKGYGHGVGMSQYGADYYARQGKTWQEITEHYYKGVQLVKVDEKLQ